MADDRTVTLQRWAAKIKAEFPDIGEGRAERIATLIHDDIQAHARELAQARRETAGRHRS
jgi:hypothetical protein